MAARSATQVPQYLTAALLTLCVTSAQSVALPLDVRVQINDAPPQIFHAEVSASGTHHIDLGGHLVEARVIESGSRQFVEVQLRRRVSGTVPMQPLAISNRPAGANSYSFTVCGDRAILQEPIPLSPARCSDLPPPVTPDPCFGQCFDFSGAYEGMPAVTQAEARIAPFGATGEPMLLTGRVLDQTGIPRQGVIIYAYQHTDGKALYPLPDPPRSFYSQEHGQLRGWTLSDADGRYSFSTVKPIAAPTGDEPAHVHLFTIERGCAISYIDPVVFAGDPRLTSENSPRILKGWGGSGLTYPQRRSNGVWLVERNIRLGEQIAGYPTCERR